MNPPAPNALPSPELPDRRRGESRALLWMCVIIAANQLGFGAVVPVLPLYAQSFGVSVTAIGATIAVFGLARFVCAMPSGHFADRFGRRPTLALGGLVTFAGNMWSAWASGYTEFLLARFVAGFGAGIVITVGGIVLADISTPARRGRMMAIYQGTFLFAVGAGPFPGGLLAEHFGLAAPFFANGVAALVVGAVAWFLVAETRDFGAPAGHAGAKPAFREQLSLLALQRGFLLVCAVGFVHAIVRTGGLFNVVPLVAESRLGLSAGQIGGGIALGSVLGLIAVYPAGALADRYGRKPLIVPAALLTGLSFVGYWLASSYASYLWACVFWGVAAAIAGAAPAAYAADSAPRGMNAAAMSTYRALTDAGYVVGPIGLGLLSDLAGADSALIFCAVSIAVIALVFMRWAPETHRR